MPRIASEQKSNCAVMHYNIRATPAVIGRGRLNDIPAHFDTNLIRAEDERNDESTKGTYLEGVFDNPDPFGKFYLTDLFIFRSRASCWTGAAHFRPSRLLAGPRSPSLPCLY